MNYFQQSVHPHASAAAGPMSATPSISDVASFVIQGLVAPAAQGLSQMAVNFSDTIGSLSLRPAATRQTGRVRECDCEQNSCHCTCCIVDADLVIYAYLGERRLATFTIENDRSREKDIRLTLSDFTTRAGRPAGVKGALFPPTEFKLKPCETQHVVMSIESDITYSNVGGAAPTPQIPDVEDCTVSYADLRVDGCEMRPLRIAVAITPRDCGAYRIRCRSCCC